MRARVEVQSVGDVVESRMTHALMLSHRTVHLGRSLCEVPFSYFRQSVRYLGPPSSESYMSYRLLRATLVLKVNPKLIPAQAQSIVLSHDLTRNGLRSRGWLVLSWTRTRARR